MKAALRDISGNVLAEFRVASVTDVSIFFEASTETCGRPEYFDVVDEVNYWQWPISHYRKQFHAALFRDRRTAEQLQEGEWLVIAVYRNEIPADIQDKLLGMSDLTTETCPECFGTGYRHGFGPFCSRGCGAT